MTDILTRLENLVDSMPEGSSVSFTADQLRTWLGKERTREDENADIQPDLRVAEVAKLLGRKEATVRGWIRRGELDAYRIQNREIRVTRDAIKKFYLNQRGQGV